ncbi:SH3 domain [Geosmithia morbida]|uniref:SH3 domain n=1 Tax=Geosmithia morbida TaxID=1094350 RepID=A0A9P4Z289_9HYPO|nr:SH3 domain [Geosmithia morbida]KAF4126837.1 SH3 domain [Geosmithia morbida]
MPISHRHAHRERSLGEALAESFEHAIRRDHNVEEAPVTRNAPRAIPTAIEKPTQTTSLGTEIAKATGEASVTSEQTIAGDSSMSVPTSTSSSRPSSSQTGDSQDSGGLGAGATAGIVFGILGGILLISLVIYFAISRRHTKKREEENSEKLTPLGPAPPTRDNAPRLSLQASSHFFPAGSGANKAGVAGTYGRNSPSQERPGTRTSSHEVNPFTNQAERASSPPTPDRSTKPGRETSMGRASPSDMDLTLPDSRRPPSPSGTVFSVSSVAAGSAAAAPSAGAAAIAAAGGPANTAVHRVQLDFKPSLSDEMELRAGDLVRLLHEYDDGWALCIRLDRSRQGVVPRTCLSTRPVKPRPPQGVAHGTPPANPQGQRSGSSSRPSPSSSGGMRSQSPTGRPISPAGRPRAPSKAHGPSPMNPGFKQDVPPGMAM